MDMCRGMCAFQRLFFNLKIESNQVLLQNVTAVVYNFIKLTRINPCLENFTFFSRKIFRRCLTFDAVYIMHVRLLNHSFVFDSLIKTQTQQNWKSKSG